MGANTDQEADLWAMMSTMGTCRWYTDEAVSDEQLLLAARAASWAPQGGNRQPVRFVAVQDPELKRQLRERYLVPWNRYRSLVDRGGLHGAARAGRSAADHFANHLDEIPALVVVTAERGALHLTDTELDRPSVVGGASIYPAVQNFLLACRAQGLGAALTTLLVEEEVWLRDLLGIPDEFLVAAMLAVGHPAREFPKKLKRVEPEEVIFRDAFGARFTGTPFHE